MTYFAVAILVGILLLFLYYSRLDKIEKKYNIEFLRMENSQFPRFIDVWKSRKLPGHPGLRSSIITIALVRVAAMVAMWGTLLLYIIRD